MTAAEPLDAERLLSQHYPDCAEKTDGTRGHFCKPCSDAWNDYIDWPCPTLRSEVERLQAQEQRMQELAAMNRKHAGFPRLDPERPVMVPCSVVADDIERALSDDA